LNPPRGKPEVNPPRPAARGGQHASQILQRPAPVPRNEQVRPTPKQAQRPARCKPLRIKAKRARLPTSTPRACPTEAAQNRIPAGSGRHTPRAASPRRGARRTQQCASANPPTHTTHRNTSHKAGAHGESTQREWSKLLRKSHKPRERRASEDESWSPAAGHHAAAADARGLTRSRRRDARRGKAAQHLPPPPRAPYKRTSTTPYEHKPLGC
jgi:hypothetical protein